MARSGSRAAEIVGIRSMLRCVARAICMDRVMLVAWTASDRDASRKSGPCPCARAPDVGDPALLIRGADRARRQHVLRRRRWPARAFVEAAELAQGLDDPWIWSQIYVEAGPLRDCVPAIPVAVEKPAANGLKVSTAIGNHASIAGTAIGLKDGHVRTKPTITVRSSELAHGDRRSVRCARHDVASCTRCWCRVSPEPLWATATAREPPPTPR